MAETADMRLVHGCRTRIATGSAQHYTREAAMAAAVGEAVERYCGSAVPDELPTATAADLGDCAVPPERFVLFHPSQYAEPGFLYRPFLNRTRVRWTKGVAVATGASVYLPAQLVYLSSEGTDAPGDTPIGYATSSGMACAPTADEAILAGLLELVERDAVMLAWYARWSPPQLVWRRNPELRAVEHRHYAASGLSYECLDLSGVHGIPTVLVAVRGSDVGVAVGAASALRPEAAWLKAMREAFATYAWAERLRRTPPPRARSRLHQIQTFADHVRFYADPRHRAFAAFLWRSPEAHDISDLPWIAEPTPAQQIAAVSRRLHAAGASAYAVDLTTPDVRRAGVQVWKAVSPELQPLDVGYRRRFWGGRRVYSMAAGVSGRDVSSPAGLNQWPHPFP
jgi:ribosomal protein S12 methylthiotransferase accessory factor